MKLTASGNVKDLHLVPFSSCNPAGNLCDGANVNGKVRIIKDKQEDGVGSHFIGKQGDIFERTIRAAMILIGLSCTLFICPLLH